VNGVHDLGGMHGFGPIRSEKTEPTFHELWEGRVYAIDRSLSAFGKWNIDAWRYHIETLPPADYLNLSYYEKWLAATERRVVQYGFVSVDELEAGKADPGFSKATPALNVEIARNYARNIPSAKDPSITALFQVGQQVRTRNINPVGHTRLPRYARAKTGQIIRDHGVYSLPDSSAAGTGEKRQHLYSVRFPARELWGSAATSKFYVHLDLWDDYLDYA
jgi:nitrile hydratase subunit beta